MTNKTVPTTFWDDVANDLDDPEYAREFALQQNRVQTFDLIMNTLIDGLAKAGITKAAVARATGANPASVRRLLNPGCRMANPTIGTIADVAAVLGYKISVQPMTAAERIESCPQPNSTREGVGV